MPAHGRALFSAKKEPSLVENLTDPVSVKNHLLRRKVRPNRHPDQHRFTGDVLPRFYPRAGR